MDQHTPGRVLLESIRLNRSSWTSPDKVRLCLVCVCSIPLTILGWLVCLEGCRYRQAQATRDTGWRHCVPAGLRQTWQGYIDSQEQPQPTDFHDRVLEAKLERIERIRRSLAERYTPMLQPYSLYSNALIARLIFRVSMVYRSVIQSVLYSQGDWPHFRGITSIHIHGWMDG